MRDQNRIQKYCAELADYWRLVPDWRFGQLMVNLLRAYSATHDKDVFFEEDEEFFKFVAEFFDKQYLKG